ncbi:ABC transporter ATP-binding protein [Arcanobacterium haemolyticum]|nr:ABC transporter ATP-binding protein [Arcanobacterium haemolyticum]
MTVALDVRDLTVTYPDGFQAVRGVDCVVPDGSVLALLGASGSGKSSVLRGIAGLEANVGGQIVIDGRSVRDLPVHERGVGMVFQSPQLFPHRSVGRNVAYGIEKRMSRSEVKEEVERLLHLVGLEGFADRAVTTLSGGQAQRCALARSLAPKPRILLLDEPLSALDRSLREELSQELREILSRAGTAAVYVTHDHDEAFTVADEIAIVAEGKIAQSGTPAELFAHPGPLVRDFLKVTSVVHGTIVGKLRAGVRVRIESKDVEVPGVSGDVGDDVAIPLGRVSSLRRAVE